MKKVEKVTMILASLIFLSLLISCNNIIDSDDNCGNGCCKIERHGGGHGGHGGDGDCDSTGHGDHDGHGDCDSTGHDDHDGHGDCDSTGHDHGGCDKFIDSSKVYINYIR